MHWAINTQAPANQAEEAMDKAFSEIDEPDDATKAQYETAKTAVKDFVSDLGGNWFQINASGFALPEEPAEGDRPHLSIGVTPVAKPFGTEG